MRVVAFVLALVSSVFAYSVLTPNGSQGWTNQGGQTLTWQRVDTDRLNFTVLLINQNVTGFVPQVLAALVDGTLGKTSLNPPSGGWPTGTHFRVNLVQDQTNLNAILAQSPEFSIDSSTSSISSTTTKGTTTGSVTASVTASGSNPSNTDPITIPTSAAMSDQSLNAGFLALFSLLGFVLA